MELVGNEVIVPVRINGLQPSSFLLDTGTDTSLVDAARAEQLGLARNEPAQAEGQGGKILANLVGSIKLEMPGLRVAPNTLAAVPLDSLSAAMGGPVQGLLGTDILTRFVVEIDYARMVLRFYAPGSYRYTGHGAKFGLTMIGGIPYVRARVVVPGRGQKEGKFAIDSGFSGAIEISGAFVDAHRLSPSSFFKTIPWSSETIGGAVEEILGRTEGFRLGPYTLAEPIVAIRAKVPGADGAIGGEILRRFTVILDFPQNRLILEPNRHFSERFVADMSGLRLKAEGKNFNVFEVATVVPHSPASEARLAAGDIITEIDGRPASGYTLEDIRELFKQQEQKYRLEVRRGQQQWGVTLTMRPIL